MSRADVEKKTGRDLITVRDAYLAMYYFMQAYWERGGRREGNVALLLTAVEPQADPIDPTALQTDDPAMWNDWLEAVNAAATKGVP